MTSFTPAVRVSAALSVLALATSLTGCGGEEQSSAAQGGTSAAARQAVERFQAALVSQNAAATCHYVSPMFWRAISNQTVQSVDKSSCAAVAAQGFQQPGRFNEQVAMATISSVTLDARRTTAKVRFMATFDDLGDHVPKPWQLRLRFARGHWLVDRLCSLSSPGQDVLCLGSTS